MSFADRPPTAELRMRARAEVVRRLIRHGDIDPYDGLAYVIWPTEAMLKAEATLSALTCYQRAHRDAA